MATLFLLQGGHFDENQMLFCGMFVKINMYTWVCNCFFVKIVIK